MAATFDAGYFGPDSPALTSGGGQTTFEWLEGRFFLIQRFVNEHPAAPSGIAIIGAADAETFTQRYFDSRGVVRIYHMTLDDGNKITGAWEGSADGQTWKHDFGLTYSRTSPAS